MTATIIGKPPEMQFEPSRDHTFCRICGGFFQGPLDRMAFEEQTPEILFAAFLDRREWSQKHARCHDPAEHERLRISGMFCTPEATEKLVTLGIIPFQDILENEEHEHAGKQAARMPLDDAETTLKGGISFAVLRDHL